MSSKTEVLSFDELARFHGLSLMKWDEDNYASENTQLANDFFEAGQKSKQGEVDKLQTEVEELQKRIDDALKELELIHFYKTQNSNNAIEILKGE